MKRIVAIGLLLFLLASFVACATFSVPDILVFTDDASELRYQDQTYINIRNNSGKYQVDYDSEELVKIVEFPYGYGDNIETFYGNDIENPDFIVDKSSEYFYVRQDVTIDHSFMLSARDTDEPFCFRISDITTGAVIPFVFDQKAEFAVLCDFFATFEAYPSLYLWITISERDGRLYLQDVWDSDYYALTDAFVETLYNFGLDKLDQS